jgi:uncharacterized protein
MEGQIYYPRSAVERVAAAVQDTPVVLIIGPRQCGKTTLTKQFVGEHRRYVTLDDDVVLAAVRQDPVAFIRDGGDMVIDEVQRAPDLLRAIKLAVDVERRPGRYILTGSANILTLPKVSESLAGRMEVITLLPLAQSEVNRTKSSFLARLFRGQLPAHVAAVVGDELVDLVLTGGFPEMMRRQGLSRRRAWATNYVQSIIQHDVADIAEVWRSDAMAQLLRMLAHSSGQLTNFTQLGGQAGLDDKTTRRYVSIFEQLFLAYRVQPWFQNKLKRFIKTPKLHFIDTGLMAALIGATPDKIAEDRAIFGPLLETFVFGELAKEISWMDESLGLHYFRDKDKTEIDFVIENSAQSLVAVEVKAAATVVAKDFSGLRRLADQYPETFKMGVVLYDGETVVPFGDRLCAAPVSALWG